MKNLESGVRVTQFNECDALFKEIILTQRIVESLQLINAAIITFLIKCIFEIIDSFKWSKASEDCAWFCMERSVLHFIRSAKVHITR